jgi:hypothetical protein
LFPGECRHLRKEATMARLNILKLSSVAPVAPAPVPEPAPVTAPETLCRGCALAHIARGPETAQELLLCGLGGWLRDLPFPVVRCTDYRAKRGERLEVVGFGAGV